MLVLSLHQSSRRQKSVSLGRASLVGKDVELAVDVCLQRAVAAVPVDAGGRALRACCRDLTRLSESKVGTLEGPTSHGSVKQSPDPKRSTAGAGLQQGALGATVIPKTAVGLMTPLS